LLEATADPKTAQKDFVQQLVVNLARILLPDFLNLLKAFRLTMQGARRVMYDECLTLQLETSNIKREASQPPADANAKRLRPTAAETSLKRRCCVCDQSLRTPFESNCGHVACHDCWSSLLEQQQPACPICSSIISRKQLKKLYLFS